MAVHSGELGFAPSRTHGNVVTADHSYTSFAVNGEPNAEKSMLLTEVMEFMQHTSRL